MSRAKFKAGQVVCWRMDNTFLLKIFRVLLPPGEGQVAYEMANPGNTGPWAEKDLRRLTKREAAR